MMHGKKALLLDMNSTFMFGEDRFGDDQDFSVHYARLGGSLLRNDINRIIRHTYEYLKLRYPDEKYRHEFPSLASAIHDVCAIGLPDAELAKIIDTFAFHELGTIPHAYAAALHMLRKKYVLAAVIDIWSPKAAWLDTFERSGIAPLFSALSFSSDHGMVKPSPKPFEQVLVTLGVAKADAVVIGDSPRRDLGGATNAGIDCILVGGAKHPKAIASVVNLLALCEGF
ncbi:MAG: HAD family hydrolase [Gammaproteobacteria bacterium]|nr:HAD family hydrolase [Gammaproteobacteria bacterium]